MIRSRREEDKDSAWKKATNLWQHGPSSLLKPYFVYYDMNLDRHQDLNLNACKIHAKDHLKKNYELETSHLVNAMIQDYKIGSIRDFFLSSDSSSTDDEALPYPNCFQQKPYDGFLKNYCLVH